MVTKKLFIPIFPMFLLCGIVTGTASAQDGNSPQSSTAATGWNVKHSASSEITVTGTIQQVTSEHTPGGPGGLHLFVNGPQGVLDTSVGPHLTEDVQRALSTGQQVQVVGVIQTINGRNYLLARQLILAGRQIPIRNENGFFIHAQPPAGNRSQRSQSEPNGGIQ
jgi:hypothetical protein